MSNKAHATTGHVLPQRQDRLPFDSAVMPSVRVASRSQQASIADSAYTLNAAKHASGEREWLKGWRVSGTI